MRSSPDLDFDFHILREAILFSRTSTPTAKKKEEEDVCFLGHIGVKESLEKVRFMLKVKLQLSLVFFLKACLDATHASTSTPLHIFSPKTARSDFVHLPTMEKIADMSSDESESWTQNEKYHPARVQRRSITINCVRMYFCEFRLWTTFLQTSIEF